MTRNNFSFNGQHFLQIHGTAMGKIFAPSYANIYMASWEQTAFSKCKELPIMYFRYLDDLFGLWTFGLDAFDNFIEVLNTTQIKVTSNIQSHKLEFFGHRGLFHG